MMINEDTVEIVHELAHAMFGTADLGQLDLLQEARGDARRAFRG